MNQLKVNTNAEYPLVDLFPEILDYYFKKPSKNTFSNLETKTQRFREAFGNPRTESPRIPSI